MPSTLSIVFSTCDFVLFLLGTAILTVLAARHVALRANLRADLICIRESLRAFSRTQATARGFRLNTQEGSRLWHAIAALLSRMRALEQIAPAFDNVLSLAPKIRGPHDKAEVAADNILRLVLTEISNARFGAIALHSDRCLDVELVASRGLTNRRLREALLEALRSNKTGGLAYYQSHGLWDFRTFGVLLSLVLPFPDGDGVLWLGFTSPSSQLEPSQKKFLEAVIKQGAASLATAKKLQESNERVERGRDWLLGISHDLRAPGNTALFALRDIRSGEIGPLTTEQQAQLLIAEESIHEQLSLLCDFFDLAKYSKGYLCGEPAAVPLHEAISPISKRFESAARAKGLRLLVSRFENEAVLCDRTHLRRIITNLLGNAIAYTDSGSVEINVASSASHIEVSILDTGKGISDEEKPFLFTEFSRLKSSNGRHGLGLGLALSKALAQKNGGTLLYSPNTPAGSIFTLVLKRAENIAKASPSTPQKILLVDDDPASCRSLARQAGSSICVQATSVEEAVALARTSDPEVVLTDYFIGEHTAEHLLLGLHKEGMKPACILVSGCCDEERLSSLKERFDVTVLEKPVATEDLQSALKNASEKRV